MTPSPTFKARALNVVLTTALLVTSAMAGYFGGGLIAHGHTGPADGGLITNLTLLGNLTAPGVVKISTGTSFSIAPGSFSVPNNTSFISANSVPNSTGSFVVSGTTVGCSGWGSFTGASGLQGSAGIGMDGNIIGVLPKQTMTAGPGFCFGSTGGLCGFGFPEQEFQVTPGPHTFYMAVFTNGATATFPASQSTGGYKCREVPSR